MTRLYTMLAAATAAMVSGTAWAQAPEGAGKPVDGAMGFQTPVTPVMENIVWLDTFMHVILAGIVALVTILLAIVAVKYRASRHPTPKTFTHNTMIEIIWTTVPVVILVIIAIPSLKLLFEELEVPKADVTIKAIGNQWYWDYEYLDEGISLSATMIGGGSAELTPEIVEELKEAGYTPDEWKLATDERVVVPVDKVVHVLTTANNVIHSWTVPSFGSKIDAMPGRINETWFKATHIGTYFGQCSELCGKSHAFMPIVVEVVSQEDYDTWVLEQTAQNGTGSTTYAKAD